MLLLMFGAALLYGDGCITPAISVLSAVEGLEGFAPRLTAFVLPITLAILLALFAVQRFGTGPLGALLEESCSSGSQPLGSAVWCRFYRRQKSWPP